MPYRGIHRRRTSTARWLRRSAIVSVVAAGSVAAPLAVTAPVVAQAAVTSPDTLAAHPGWARSAVDPAVAPLVADLAARLTARGVPYTRIAAYRVPTVDGFVTYVTDRPQTFTVRPNPDLFVHTPDGAARSTGSAVVSRYIEDAVHVAQEVGTDVGESPARVEQTLSLMLVDRIVNSVNKPPTPDVGPWIDYALAALAPYVDSIGSLLDQAMLTADMWAGEASRLVADALQQALTALNDLDADREAGAIVDVVPLAIGALPVNTGTAATIPLSQPVAQPVDPVLAVAPPIQALYGNARDDKPEWNRNNDDCYLVSSKAWYRQVCWNIDNQINDDSADYTYWQFNLEGSSYPKQSRGMLRTWVEGRPQQAAAAQRFDGRLPEPNQEIGGQSGCSDQTRSLTMSGGSPIQVGYGYSFSYTTCETYTPRGYDDAGHWANIWNYNSSRDPDGMGAHSGGTVHMRNVAFTMGVKTKAADGGPVWDLLTGTEVTKQWPAN